MVPSRFVAGEGTLGHAFDRSGSSAGEVAQLGLGSTGHGADRTAVPIHELDGGGLPDGGDLADVHVRLDMVALGYVTDG